MVLLLGWGRALLLQLTHPLVAQGIADHGSFTASYSASIRRLRHTLEAMVALTFGTPWEVNRAAHTINARHDRVHGRLRKPSGIWPQGTFYTAHDPELLTWVHATLLDTFIRTYELYVGVLSREEKDLYCRESTSIGSLLGIPRGYLPDSFEELNQYMDKMLADDAIAVTETARTLAAEILFLSKSSLLQPLLWPFRWITIGLLPSEIREAYGFRWNLWNQKLLNGSARMVRVFLPLVPSIFRAWPDGSWFWLGLLKWIEWISSTLEEISWKASPS